MKKKIILAIVALVAVSLGVVGMSAFEAHIINVTAHIENALTVPVEADGMSFGTVFPEEVSFQNMDIQLSSSFLATERVDDIEYMIRQKPKCGVPLPDTNPVEYSSYPPVGENDDGRFICPDGSVMLPLLCPYLSKHEVNGPGNIEAFHGPLTNWTMADTLATQLTGRLSKADNKTSAAWVIDLHAPCFKGMCAQDNVIPPAYQYDPAFEGQLFGCDLWVEVTGISKPPPPESVTTLTVIKHVVNDDQTENKSAADFTMHVAGTNVSNPDFPGAESPGTTVTLTPGDFSVSEDPLAGYSSIFTGDCSGVIAAGQNLTCTVENNDNPPDTGTLTINKILDPANDSGKFNLQIDGLTLAADQGNNGTTGAQTFTAGSVHTFGEVAGTATNLNDYTSVISGPADCDDGSVTIIASQNITCTITNTLKGSTITVNKVVINHIDGTNTNASNFQMKIDDSDVAQGTPIPVTANVAHTISETGPAGYTTTFSGACNGTNQVTVAPGENVTCTVTNEQQFGTIIVNKTVKNDDGGLLTVGNFTLKVDTSVVASGIPKKVAPGAHTVSEVGVFGYSTTIGGDCNVAGHVTVGAGENKICTILNDDIKPSIELIKSVVGGSAEPDDFDVSIDGSIVTSGSSNAVIANIAHVIDEEATVSGYSFTSITGVSFKGVACPAILSGTITLLPGDVVTCTITNTFSE